MSRIKSCSMNENFDILLVGQTPPPFHGQAVVTEMLFDHDWGDLEVERLRMAYSDSIDDVGKAGIGKVLHLLSLIWQTWMIVFRKRPKVLYYLPSSANKTPVIRDIIYLGAVRWCFSKTVFHYHAGGLPEYLESAGIMGKVAKKLYSGADLSVEICKTEHSPGVVFKAKNTVYIPNGLDVNCVSRVSSDGAKFRALLLGALNEGKGVLDVVRTAKFLKDRVCDIEFRVVGAWASGEFKAQAEALVVDEGLEEAVFFPGPKKGLDKWQEYADCDVFLFPSHYQSENFPLVLIEAMAFSLPVISTNWRGIPQLVGDSETAILCDINKPAQYAEALLEVWKTPELRQRMGQAARKHYEAHYTREKFVGAMEEAFKEVVKL